MIRSCSECRYFQPGQRPSTEAHDGTCRFSPPSNYSTPLPEPDEPEPEPDEFGTVGLLTIHDTTYTGWPVVQASDWCGEWAPHPRSEVQRQSKAERIDEEAALAAEVYRQVTNSGVSRVTEAVMAGLREHGIALSFTTTHRRICRARHLGLIGGDE